MAVVTVVAAAVVVVVVAMADRDGGCFSGLGGDHARCLCDDCHRSKK